MESLTPGTESKKTCDTTLWSLQFDRWWGWNWLRKHEDWMKKQLITNNPAEPRDDQLMVCFCHESPCSRCLKKPTEPHGSANKSPHVPAKNQAHVTATNENHFPQKSQYYDKIMVPERDYNDNQHQQTDKCCLFKRRSKLNPVRRKQLQSGFTTPCGSHEYVFGDGLFQSAGNRTKSSGNHKKRKDHTKCRCRCESMTSTSTASSSSYSNSSRPAKERKCCCRCCCHQQRRSTGEERIDMSQYTKETSEEGVQTFMETFDRFTQTLEVQRTDKAIDNSKKSGKKSKKKRRDCCCCCCCCCCCDQHQKQSIQQSNNTNNKRVVDASQQYEKQQAKVASQNVKPKAEEAPTRAVNQPQSDKTAAAKDKKLKPIDDEKRVTNATQEVNLGRERGVQKSGRDCLGAKCLCCERCTKNETQNAAGPTGRSNKKTFAAQHYNAEVAELRLFDYSNRSDTLKLLRYNTKKDDEEHKTIIDSILSTIVKYRTSVGYMNKPFPSFKRLTYERDEFSLTNFESNTNAAPAEEELLNVEESRELHKIADVAVEDAEEDEQEVANWSLDVKESRGFDKIKYWQSVFKEDGDDDVPDDCYLCHCFSSDGESVDDCCTN